MRRPAGYYNRLITIRDTVPVPTRGAIDTKNPVLLCERFARPKSGGAREQTKRSQTHATVDTIFELPYDDIASQTKPDMQILYAARVYEIHSVEDVDDLHEELRITTTERVN